MNEEDLTLLVTLQRTHNITKTAELMGLTQPAVTRRIQLLEDDLGVSLLIRSRNGVCFTPAGESLLPSIHTLIDTFRGVRETAQANSGRISGKIRIGASINYVQYGMTDPLARFARAYPDVSVDVESAQSWHVYRRLLSKDLSLAVLRGRYKWDGLTFCFHREPIYLIARSPVSMEDLHSMRYLHRTMEDTLDRSIHRWFLENHLTQKYQIHMDNIMAVIALVEEGLGWGIVPGACLKSFRGFKMPISFQDGSELNRHTFLLCTREYIQFPQVQLFCLEILRSGNIPEAREQFETIIEMYENGNKVGVMD